MAVSEPFGTRATFRAPRLCTWAIKPGELTTTWSAWRYRKRSNHSEAAIKARFRNTPTDTAKAGQRSRTSNRKGTLLSRASAHAVAPWNMGGEVPHTRSTSFTPRPIRKDEAIKLKKLNTRCTKLRCNAG